MKAGWGIVLLIAPLMGLSGCHIWRGASAKSCHAPQPYMQAKSVPPLIVPGGLDAPDTTNALKLPQLNEPASPARHGNEPCLDEPPSFKVAQPQRTPQA